MKKLFVIFAVCSLSMMAMAQTPALVGAWQQLDANGRPTNQFKFFMPDGRLLGLSYNSDFTNSSVWFMSDYKVLNDSAFVDHAFYHCDINYQRDYLFTFHKENDSVMVTRYVDYRYNNVGADMTERWKKSDRPLPAYTDAEWQALHRKSMAEFDRLPTEGQTVEQFAQELYDKAEDYKKTRRLAQAGEALLIRAELDTTNLQWQKDASELFLYNNMAPSVAEKIANRYIRLKEKAAPVANDTSVVNAYRRKASLYYYRGNACLSDYREAARKTIALETAAGHQPSNEFGSDYFLLAMSYMPEGNFEAMYDHSLKAIDILEKVPGADKNRLGSAYMAAAISLSQLDRNQEALDLLKNKIEPLYTDDNGRLKEEGAAMIYPLSMDCYEALLGKNPKDKKLFKEYRQFLSDKLTYAVFDKTDKKRNLFGKFLVLERNQWTLEKPTATFDNNYILLQRDGEYIDFFKEKDEEVGAHMYLEVVDAAVKKDIIRQWKAYKKNKK